MNTMKNTGSARTTYSDTFWEAIAALTALDALALGLCPHGFVELSPTITAYAEKNINPQTRAWIFLRLGSSQKLSYTAGPHRLPQLLQDRLGLSFDPNAPPEATLRGKQ